MSSRLVARLAVSALVLVALAALGVTAYVQVLRPARSGPVATAATPTPSSIEVVDHGTPPPGRPVVYVATAARPSWLQAVDWNGSVVGTVKLPDVLGGKIYSQGTALDAIKGSPDGSEIRVGDSVYDQSGHLVGGLPADRVSSTWADDSHRLCGIRSQAGATGQSTPVLTLDEPGKPSRDIVQLPATQPGDSGFAATSCSPTHDRAIVSIGVGVSPTEWWLVRLSDGALLHHEQPGRGRYMSMVSSADARLTAASATAGPGEAPSSVVQNAVDGTTVTSFPTSEVLAFSDDARQVLVFQGPLNTGTYQVVGLADPNPVWSRSGPSYFVAGAVEPGGQAFVMALAHRSPSAGAAPCQDVAAVGCTQEGPLNLVLIVRGDGGEVVIGDSLIPGW